MAWPRKGTRELTVDAVVYRCHYSAHCPLCSDDVLTIGKSGAPYVLYIDPFPWHFDFRPATIVEAVRWARDQGWTAEHGPTRAMSLDDRTRQFVWLPAGKRHLESERLGSPGQGR